MEDCKGQKQSTHDKVLETVVDSKKSDKQEPETVEAADESRTETAVDTPRESADEDKENGEVITPEEAIHWRINFRHRNRVPSDQIVVDSTTPTEELARNPIGSLEKNEHGQTTARHFQFRHELKDSTYKNKYILQIDSHKMKFSERDDSILIRSDGDATVHMGTSSNNLFRNRNMAMEELRKALKLNLCVWKSLFMSNRAEQMGVVNLGELFNSVSTTNLTVIMDSYPNVVQFIKIHRTPITKLTVLCQDDYLGITELEQVRTATNLKLVGRTNISDTELMTLEANNFEISSDSITSEGLNVFIKAKLAGDIADDFLAVIDCNRGEWVPDDVLTGLEYVEYEDEDAYREKNGCLPVNLFDGTLVSMETNKPGEKMVVIIQKYYFECFKESKKPRQLSHDIIDLD